MSDVIVERGEVSWRITLDRPAKRNALTFAMMSEIAAALAGADRAPDVRVVVLAASPGAFCAGNDLADMAAHPTLADDSPPLLMLDAVRVRDFVLVAAVDGAAVGVGATLLTLCDLVYATEASSISFPFVKLGLAPEAGSTLQLPRTVGRQRANEALLLGDSMSAVTAHAWGLVNRVLRTRVELDGCVDDVVGRLLRLPAAGLLATRRLLSDETATTLESRMRLDAEVLRGLLAGGSA